MEQADASQDTLPPAQPYTPHAWLRWLYRRFFRHIHVDEQWMEAVRAASQQGTVVYVMRSLSFLDFLCLDFLVKRFELPLIRFVNDLGLWILEPFGKGERRLRFRRQVPEERALQSTLLSHFSALLFLRKPPRLGQSARKGTDLQVDLIRTLISTQRRSDRPILLVPQTFVWSKLPPRRSRSWLDVFFGPSEWPGKLRVLVQFVLNYRNVLLRSGEPFDLAAFLRDEPELSDEAAADKVRLALLRRIERERTLVLGPTKKPPLRLQQELMRSPRVRKHILGEARATQKPVAAVEAEVRRELRRLCAAQSSWALAIYHRLLDVLWRRIYDGLEVDKPGLERLRQAARRGALIIVPSHKSHIDYLVLSDVFYANALLPPLIAAGDNLSFWPLGALLRRAGAFFIRRSFRGSKLYPALVDAYLRKLLLEGFTLEFFIEGGRSRTGTPLVPKLGLLSMIVDAALLLRRQPIYFAPVSITYERVVEQRSYVHELSGGEKRRESLSSLLKTPAVLLSRYGRLYVQFGEVISFDTVLEEQRRRRTELGGGSMAPRRGSAHELGAHELSAAERRNLVKHLAARTMYEIHQVTMVTPASLAATALLSRQSGSMGHAELQHRSDLLLRLLRQVGARIAPIVVDAAGRGRDDALRQAIALFVDAKLLVETSGPRGDPVYELAAECRLELEFYKNNILHFFVARALLATGLLAEPGGAAEESVLKERVRWLSALLKYEFTYKTAVPFDQVFADELAGMRDAGEIIITEAHEGRKIATSAGGGEQLELYASMIAPHLDAHRVLLQVLQSGGESLRPGDHLGKQALLAARRLSGVSQPPLGSWFPEALSRHKLQNAWSALRDLGYVDAAEPSGDAAAGEAVPPAARRPNRSLAEFELRLEECCRSRPQQ